MKKIFFLEELTRSIFIDYAQEYPLDFLKYLFFVKP